MTKNIPLIIRGIVQDTSAHEHIKVSLNESDIFIPVINKNDTNKIIEDKKNHNLSLNEIVNFLYSVGQRWKNEEYSRRRMYIRNLKKYLAYSSEMAKLEANWIAMILSSKSALYDTVKNELGSRHIVDEWIPQDDSYIKAIPRGKSVHLLAGNVPLSGVTSIIRAILTKNECIIKTSSSDPFTATALALSFIDVDSEHAITRSMTVLYWSHEKDIELPKLIMKHADIVIAWGGTEAIKWAVKHTPAHINVMKFGPKKSISIIENPENVVAAAEGLAHDVCFYDQQACFSTQNVYYMGDSIDLFATELEKQFIRYEKILPKAIPNFDEQAAFTLTEKESLFAGYNIKKGINQTWMIIQSPSNSFGTQPLGRCIYLHKVSGIADILPHIIKNETQTVTIYPWKASFKYRDILISHGAERIIESGMNNLFRSGGAHDGMCPLQHLVKYVSHERPSNYTSKDVAVEIDQTRYLEEDKFLVFVP